MQPSPLLTIFFKFGAVGGSGVVVNLAFLAGFRWIGFHDSLSSALAIEVSIISNFILNERWTFRERLIVEADQHNQVFQRALRFQLVSFIGAVAQWNAFLLCNVLWAYLGLSADPSAELWSTYAPRLIQGGWQALILNPPRVGDWVYVSQLIGIAVATVWNFLLNYYWTWGRKPSA